MRIWRRLSSIMWCLLCVCVPGIQNYPVPCFFQCISIINFTSFANWKKAAFLPLQWFWWIRWPDLEDQLIVFSTNCVFIVKVQSAWSKTLVLLSALMWSPINLVLWFLNAPNAPLHTAFRFSSSTEQSSSRLMRRHRRRRRKPKASNMDRVRGHDVDETRDWKLHTFLHF